MMSAKRRGLAAIITAVVLVVVSAACEPAESPTAGPPKAARCDPIGGRRCLLPFPNDFYSVPDRTTDTGRRVHINRLSTPMNASGVHIDTTEQNRNDGFSPGSILTAQFRGIDLARSGVAPITDMAASLRPDAPIVLIDSQTGERHPYWAELDANATSDDNRLLLIHPAVNLTEGHRYVIGLRNLKRSTGRPIRPTNAFRAYRDGFATGKPSFEQRRPAMARIFRDLRRAGVARRDLTLAWDFTVASERNLSERLLSMRDDAFAALGSAAPAFQVTSVETPETGPVLRRVRGSFQVPRYLTGNGEPGSFLNNGTKGDPIPVRNGTQTANFDCIVPRTAVAADGRANPTRMALYGHGLLGTASQVVGAGSRFAEQSNTSFCATDWIGMASEDIGNAVSLLQDLSTFRSFPDRLQQGILHFLFLGRLMKHRAGFSSAPAFQDARGRTLLDRRNLTFVGLSQGGILGGAVSAVAQDWERSFLGVPAMNYSLLLNRSIDFDVYATIYDPAYPDPADRQLGIQLIQMLWDRGENNGYAQHMTRDPYRGTRAKQIFLFEAFGDHQVANVATEVMARTIGARVRVPVLAPGRSPDVEPAWGIRPVRKLPDKGGSYLVIWDFGTPAPPTTNTPPRAGDDPHGAGSRSPEVIAMTNEFLRTGRLIDVCGGLPCRTVEDGG